MFSCVKENTACDFVYVHTVHAYMYGGLYQCMCTVRVLSCACQSVQSVSVSVLSCNACPVMLVPSCYAHCVLQPDSGASVPSDTHPLQGKRNLQHQTSTGSAAAAAAGVGGAGGGAGGTTGGGGRMRSQLANAILGGEGTARDLLARRKKGAFGQCEWMMSL